MLTIIDAYEIIFAHRTSVLRLSPTALNARQKQPAYNVERTTATLIGRRRPSKRAVATLLGRRKLMKSFVDIKSRTFVFDIKLFLLSRNVTATVMNDGNTSNMPSTTALGRDALPNESSVGSLGLDIENIFLYSHIRFNQCLDFDISFITINKTRMERD